MADVTFTPLSAAAPTFEALPGQASPTLLQRARNALSSLQNAATEGWGASLWTPNYLRGLQDSPNPAVRYLSAPAAQLLDLPIKLGSAEFRTLQELAVQALPQGLGRDVAGMMESELGMPHPGIPASLDVALRPSREPAPAGEPLALPAPEASPRAPVSFERISPPTEPGAPPSAAAPQQAAGSSSAPADVPTSNATRGPLQGAAGTPQQPPSPTGREQTLHDRLMARVAASATPLAPPSGYRLLYHEGPSDLSAFAAGEANLLGQRPAARQGARGPLHVWARTGKTLDINGAISGALDAGHNMDEAIAAATQNARAQGFRFATYDQPSAEPGAPERPVTVSLYPHEDLVIPGRTALTPRPAPMPPGERPASEPGSPFVPVPPEPERLINFLRRAVTLNKGHPTMERTIPGGLKDVGGNVAHIIGGPRGRPGLINNRDGRSLDNAVTWAFENGYFPTFTPEEPPEINDLLEAIEEDLKGSPRYSAHDSDELLAYEHAVERNREVERLSTELGIPTEGKTAAHFFDTVANRMSQDEWAAQEREISDALEASMGRADRAHEAWSAYNGEQGADEEPSLEELEHEWREASDAAAVAPGDVEGEGSEATGARPGALQGSEGSGGRAVAHAGRGDEANPDDWMTDENDGEYGLAAPRAIRMPRLRRGVATLIADAQSASDWRDWYERHVSTIRDIFGDDADLFHDLLSATSQAATVASNVSLALKALTQMKEGAPFTGYLPAVIKNLERIRAAETAQGQKIASFQAANRGDPMEFVVDRHISELLFGTGRPTPAMVRKAKATGAKVAKALGWTPREVQAALWAANQVRKGTKPEDVASYDSIIRDRERAIRDLLAGFARAAPEGTTRGDGAPAAASEAGAEGQQGLGVARQPRAEGLADPGSPARSLTPERVTGLPVAPRESLWRNEIGSNGGRDLIRALPHSPPDRAVSSALDWLVDFGRASRDEAMVVFDDRSGEPVHAHTNDAPGCVYFDRGNTKGGDYTILHNHPSGYALSSPDLAMLTAPGVSRVAAVGHGGELYVAALADPVREMREYNPGLAREVMVDGYREAYEKVATFVRGAFARGETDRDEGNKFASDAVGRILAGEGLITYLSTHEIPEKFRPWLEEVLTENGTAPDRLRDATSAARYDAGVAGLRDAMGRNPGGAGEPVPAGGPRGGEEGDRGAAHAKPHLLPPEVIQGARVGNKPFRLLLNPSPIRLSNLIRHAPGESVRAIAIGNDLLVAAAHDSTHDAMLRAFQAAGYDVPKQEVDPDAREIPGHFYIDGNDLGANPHTIGGIKFRTQTLRNRDVSPDEWPEALRAIVEHERTP